jgi:hypothetical protein
VIYFGVDFGKISSSRIKNGTCFQKFPILKKKNTKFLGRKLICEKFHHISIQLFNFGAIFLIFSSS